jgi:hypothetical protein
MEQFWDSAVNNFQLPSTGGGGNPSLGDRSALPNALHCLIFPNIAPGYSIALND